MAFLDNSGDIILDAVLTKEGREKLATGTSLDIKSFGLGDDEINYGSYNIAHPSGSAYYDLEVLQTPILESITGRAAGINHGLLKSHKDTLLYLPVMKLNTNPLITTDPDFVIDGSANVTTSWLPFEGAHLMLLTDATYTTFEQAKVANELNAGKAALLADGFDRMLWRGYTAVSNAMHIILETGLDTTDIPKDESARNNYIDANNLNTRTYYTDLDSRLFVGLMSPLAADGVDGGAVSMRYNTSTGNFGFAAVTAQQALGSTGQGSSEIFNYVRTDFLAMGDVGEGFLKLYTGDSGVTRQVTDYSVISGPTSDISAIAPVPNVSRLGTAAIDTLWTDLGKKVTGAQLVNGATGTFASTEFYMIDTIVYVYQSATNASTQFTIRLIRTA